MMFVFLLVELVALSAFVGWQMRSYVAEREHAWRWDNDGCRHNIECRVAPSSA